MCVGVSLCAAAAALLQARTAAKENHMFVFVALQDLLLNLYLCLHSL